MPKLESAPGLEEEDWSLGAPGPSATSGKAIASLVAGCLFVFGCLSGVPAFLFGWHALRDIKDSGGRLKGRRMAVAGIVLGLIGCLLTVAFFVPAIRSARGAARRAECANNLKQIGLAIQYYHEAYGCLPPAAITDKTGKPLLSWRVAILPHLLSDPRYLDFHFDEPWDSPHNLALLEPVPFVYTCPGDLTPKKGMTHFVAVIGPNTAFTPDFRPLTYRDFTDGIGNTLLIGESRRGVPWTKPEDLPLDMSIPFTGLGSDHGYHDNGFNVLFADGSVRFLHRSIDPKVLDAILTRDAAQVVEPNSY